MKPNGDIKNLQMQLEDILLYVKKVTVPPSFIFEASYQKSLADWITSLLSEVCIMPEVTRLFLTEIYFGK